MSLRAFLAVALITSPAAAVELRWPEGTLRGFPVLRDRSGEVLANSNLSQWIERGNLQVKVVHEFRDGRRIEEQAEFAQQPELRQLRWSLIEQRGDEVMRRFEANLEAKSATAQKLEKGKLNRWDESIDIEPGRTFAGVGFLYAVKNLRERLQAGDHIQLTAVAFTPKPRTATVTVSFDAVEKLTLGGRAFEADRYTIHPEIPAIAHLFVKTSDQHLWFYKPSPPGLLRAELPLAEPSDPMVLIDAMP